MPRVDLLNAIDRGLAICCRLRSATAIAPNAI